MTRGLHLTLAALGVVSFGVSGVFAFTPSVGPVPDVIIGDRTPDPNNSAADDPDDPFTHGDSLEGVNGQADDVFRFDDAINIFTLAEDSNIGSPGYTSDENLIYEFFATPNGTGSTLATGEQRISINGTAISTSAYTPVTVTAPGDLDFVDVAFSVSPVGAGTAKTALTIAGEGSFSYTWVSSDGMSREAIAVGDAPGVDLIDSVTMQVRVTNATAVSDEDTFFVYTVDEGADAVSGLFLGGGPVALDGWTYAGFGNAAGVFGPSYAGDTQATGLKNPDNDSDQSVEDLVLDAGTTAGDFFHWFFSPAGLIPFVQNGTYHLVWDIQSSIATPAANPTIRLRWAYNQVSSLGGGSVVANPAVAPAGAGTGYVQMFDELDVASATASVFGDPENDIRLFFETYDFDGEPTAPANVIGGGALELNNLDISQLDRGALLGATAVEIAASDYTATSLANVGFNFGGGADVTVTRTATNATLTAAGANPQSSLTLYGTTFALTDQGLGFVPFAPTAGENAYRFSLDVDSTANSTTTPLPKINIQVASFSAGFAQLYTSLTDVNALRFGAGATNPAMDGLNNYAGYLALPEGASLGGAYGPNVAGNIRLQDTDASAGSIILDNMELRSFPEAILP
jgi:hypothetical protein